MSVLSRGHAAALALLAAVLLAGCATSGEPAAPPSRPAAGMPLVVTPPSVSAAPRLESVRGLALPTDAFRPTAQESSLVAEAEQKLIVECMTQFGLTWQASSVPPTPASQADRLYGVGDLETAQRYGYHLPFDDSHERQLRRQEGGIKPLSPAEQLVLAGQSDSGEAGSGASRSYRGKQVPAGGCGGQARRQVTGVDDIDPTHLADVITVELWERSKTDPRVIEVIGAWSSCMKQANYDYQSPLAVNDSHWSMSGPVTADEIQVAQVDVRCKQHTNLIGVWFTIESGYEQQAVQQYRTQLTEIKTRWTRSARTAAQLLGRPAPS